MIIHGLSPANIGPLPGGQGGLSLPGNDDFSSTLQLGQIIKGRVLRHYDGGRYSVDFNGREKIVDSAVPLKTGELLYGKVIGLGERVELERVGTPAKQNEAAGQEAPKRDGLFQDSVGNMLADLLASHQVKPDANQLAQLERAARAAADPKLAAQAGIMLAKLGMTMSPELVRLLAELLRTDPRRGLFGVAGDAIELETLQANAAAPSDAKPENPGSIQALAELLKQMAEQGLDQPSDLQQASAQGMDAAGVQQNDQTGGESGQPGGRDPFEIARRVFNTQTGGSVAHRVASIPLLVNGRLVELDVAIFDQSGGQKQPQDATRHRRVVFSIHTEMLGRVEAEVRLTGEHLGLAFSSDRAGTSEALAGYAPELLAQMQSEGWKVDRLDYLRSASGRHAVAETVLQHVITQDSMSLLV